MQIKTLLNHLQKYKSFVYGKTKLVEELGVSTLLVEIRPRANSKLVCSQCGGYCAGYDTLNPRRFEFVPLWGIAVFFLYVMRRVDCPICGVVVESVPWAKGKEHLTETYMWFLARWAKRLSWKEVAEVFISTWENVFRSVEKAVHWGLEHRDLSEITAIGVDEILWHRGHKYLTLVYQINEDCKRLLWIGRERTEKTLNKFFNFFGDVRSSTLKFICTDMWKPYLNVVAQRAKQALNILDRFHIAVQMNKAIDKVRSMEARELEEKGYKPLLKNSRWCLLKRPENLTEKQDIKLAELLRYNLKTLRSYLLKEDFQFFWEYMSPFWAGKFLDRWCTKAMRSRIKPMKKIAKSLRNHKSLIMNWFKAHNLISMGAVEGLNNKVKVVTRRSYGFRTFKVTEIALYHTLGQLPEPKFTHRFC